MKKTHARPRPWRGFSWLLLLPVAMSMSGQNNPVRPRITQVVDEAKLTVLARNTHPLARPQFDRGPAPPDLPLNRMLLVLARSPEQDTALQSLLDEQQDNSSPNFHKWLTPEEFGVRFGPVDQDIQAVTRWLESHGFRIGNATRGRTTIEFSGSAAQVKEAFHTEIHKFVVNGEEHWANVRDPQIPTALVPVVAGIASLHNFFKHPNIILPEQKIVEGRIRGGANPQTTFTNGKHAVGPSDFALIYNVPNMLLTPPPAQQFNGDGTFIAVVARSNINTSDIQDFRQIFGLSSTNLPHVIVNGPDPGNLGQVSPGEEVEAVLDATWPGAVAPNATVDFIVSQSTETTDGVDLSELFIVENNLAPIMSESFGVCEAVAQQLQGLVAAETNVAEQAAAQGITFLAATGDSGPVCGSGQNPDQISPQIPAALPFTVAVGGTMFTQADSGFWNTTNNPTTLESVNGYIPEDAWNENCPPNVGCTPGGDQAAGGGGVSAIFTTKPVWQAGVPNLPSGGRSVPDVALNSSASHDPTIICVQDLQLMLSSTSCVPNAQGEFSVIVVGGTSVAAPSFAGIMALVNQSQNVKQGEAGYVLYKLAALEAGSPGLNQCNASTGPSSTSCVFNDVTSGNIVVPGQIGSATDFPAGTGYDLATGLGSANVANLLANWPKARSAATASALNPINPEPPTLIPHGTAVSVSGSVTATSGTPTGDVALIALMGIDQIPTGVATFTLSNGAFSGSTNLLPAGQYTVIAHYEGDGGFLPSDSSAVGVSVGTENSKMQLFFETLDANGNLLNPNATTAAYGSNCMIRMNVTGASGNTCGQNTVGQFGCPTGTVLLTDNGLPLNGNPLGVPNGAFPLNSLGVAEDQFAQLSVGSNALSATYTGDTTFNPITVPVTDSVTIAQAQTTTNVSSSATTISAGGSVTLTAVVQTQSRGVAPTGTVQFFNGATPIAGNVTLTPSNGSATVPASLTGSLTTTLSGLPAPARNKPNSPSLPILLVGCSLLLGSFVQRLKRFFASRWALAVVAAAVLILMSGVVVACGGGGGGGNFVHTDSITAKYSGDTNYSPSTAVGVSITIQ